MTRIPWGPTLSGDDAEGLIALLLFSEYPVGAQRITPSQGDGGMDVRIWSPDGWGVYQIKRYYGALDASQKAKVEGSFQAFAKEVADTHMAVKCWTVVMPWDPTREARSDFEERTKGAGFPTNWEGLTFLERLVSRHPAAADYFIGNGRERTLELIKMAMQIGTPLTHGAPEGSLVEAAVVKVREVEALLSKVDPYYKYTFAVEQAPRPRGDLHQFAQSRGTAYAKYRFLDQERCLVIRAFPRTEGMAQLRPIRLHFNLEPQEGTSAAEAVRQFFEHGTRLIDIPGSVTVVDDPTGLVDTHEGTSLISFAANTNPELPELEVRLLDGQGSLLRRVPLVKPAPSAGQIDGGFSLTAEDAGGAFTLIAKGNRKSGQYGLTITLADLAGKVPVRALPGLELARDLVPGNYLVLGVQGAGEVGHRMFIDTESPITERAADLLKFAKVLMLFQHYTPQRVIFPDFAQLSSAVMQEIGVKAGLLLGKVLSWHWTSISVTAAGLRQIKAIDSFPAGAIVERRPLTVNLGSYELTLDAEEQLIWPNPQCSMSDEELQALPDDAAVELTPEGDGIFYRRLPVEHVPRVVEID